MPPRSSLILVGAGPTAAEDEPFHMRGAQVLGGPVTPVIVNIDVRDLPAVPSWQPGDPVKEIPRRFFPPKDGTPGSYEANPDPLVDLQSAAAMRANEAFTTPIVNQAGQGYTGVNPPDTVGDIGPNHYIQSINDSGGAVVQIYDKTGSPIGAPFAMDSLGSGILLQRPTAIPSCSTTASPTAGSCRSSARAATTCASTSRRPPTR